ncbi:MAG: sulfatase [Myxococcota bacterium]
MDRRTALSALVALALLGTGIAIGTWVGRRPAAAPAKPVVTKAPDASNKSRPPKKNKKNKKNKAPENIDFRQPNVLLIVWDTVRADRMSLYGHDRPTTPGLDAFAAEARVFEHAISPATWTVPSHASLFTGLPVSTHGANASWRWVDHHNVTMAEHLAANGYATYAYSANPYVSGMTNLLQGFEVKRLAWEEDKKAAAMVAKGKLIPTDQSTEISPAYKGEKPNIAWNQSTFKEASDVANRHFVSWLRNRKQKDRPWFAFINLMEAHSPRIPSLETRQRVIGDPALIELGLKTDMSLWNEVAAIVGKHAYSDDEIRATRAVYDATLSELDEAFVALMDALDEKDALDRTVVILTSDHGESLGEHGLWEHRYGVWNTLVHVPLVIRYPKGMEPGRVQEPVSTAQIFPTVLDLLGMKPPPNAELGRSLRRTKAGLPIYTQLTDPYTSKLSPFTKRFPDLDVSRFIRTFDAMVQDGTKVVHSSDGHHELYDLVNDPAEQKNLIDAHPKAAEYLRRLEEWQRSVPRADPSMRVPGDFKKARGQQTEADAMKEMLESLGYIEDGADDEGGGAADDPMGPDPAAVP